MKRIATLAVATLLAVASQQAGVVAATAGARVTAGSVKVTINYKGQGTVDGSHRLWVWLFSSPDIGPGSMPVAEMSIDTNGGVAVFDGVTAERVWIAAAFDEQGTMSGGAPPPPGSPVGLYVGSDGAPRGVTPGDTADAALTFDDSQRMP